MGLGLRWLGNCFLCAPPCIAATTLPTVHFRHGFLFLHMSVMRHYLEKTNGSMPVWVLERSDFKVRVHRGFFTWLIWWVICLCVMDKWLRIYECATLAWHRVHSLLCLSPVATGYLLCQIPTFKLVYFTLYSGKFNFYVKLLYHRSTGLVP